MNLLVDAGNSWIKWALASGQRLETRGKFRHRDDDPAQLAEQAWGRLSPPARMLVSNVAGAALADGLSAWAVRHWQLQPVFLRAGREAAGVTNAYPIAEQLGVDRWAAMIAAWHGAGDAVCVVDCGTAITLDLVDPAGRHRGGLILPGIRLMQQALCAQTADLRVPDCDQAPVLLANGTAAAIGSGCRFAVAAAIDRLARDVGISAGLQPDVILTGGDASIVAPLLTIAARQDSDLVLKGIAILAGER